MSVAEKLHEAYKTIDEVEDVIMSTYQEVEPDLYDKLEFTMSSDDYDNSLEIYFDMDLPYPYEPSKELRERLRGLGFSMIYFNFNDGDEIRGNEPRHTKMAHWTPTKYGYVDNRFNEEHWLKNYNF